MAANPPQLGRVLGKAHTSPCSQGCLKPEAILRGQETRSPVWTRNLLPNPFSSDNGAAKKRFPQKAAQLFRLSPTGTHGECVAAC